jgi:hypothetical protein
MRKINLSDSDFMACFESETSVHVKAITGYGDPVELSDTHVETIFNFLRTFLGDDPPIIETGSIKLSNAEFNAWIEQESSVHIKSVTTPGNAVELSTKDAKKLAGFLRYYLKTQDI